MIAGTTRDISFGEFELDRTHRRLLRQGEPLAINAKTFDLLTFLVENNGRVVSKDEILEAVWEGQFVEEANLSVQVSALRKALGENKNDPRFLITIPGKGYKFVADVISAENDIIIENRKIERVVINEEIEQIDEPDAKQLAAPASGRNRYIIILAGAALAALLTFAVFKFYPAGSTDEVRSLAVLPFINQDQTPDTEYLSDGLAESVIHSLSRFPGLRVVSRNSAFRFKANDVDAKSVGAELNVQAILAGRISHVGDTLAVSTELISTADNSVIWGQQFTRKMSEIERLQSDVANAISQKLRLKLPGTGKSDRAAQNPEAYRLYLLGRYHIAKLTDAGFYKGRDNFQQAIDIDPGYAPAHAGLAEAYNRLSGFNVVPPTEGYAKARSVAKRAIELDGHLAEGHAALGIVKHFYDWDWPGAEKEFKLAVEMDPNNADTRMSYAYHLASMARLDETLTEMKTAVELDPLSIEKIAGVGDVYYYQRRFDPAIEQYRKVIEMDPNSGFGHWSLANAYLQKGMYDEAVSEYQISIPLSGSSPDETATLACAYALSGKRREALLIVDDLKQRSEHGHVPASVIAFIYSALGDKEQAFAWLEKGYKNRDFLIAVVNVEPLFAGLHGDPRFDDLLKRVGLPKMELPR